MVSGYQQTYIYISIRIIIHYHFTYIHMNAVSAFWGIINKRTVYIIPTIVQLAHWELRGDANDTTFEGELKIARSPKNLLPITNP